jgi:hypothetical protein
MTRLYNQLKRGIREAIARFFQDRQKMRDFINGNYRTTRKNLAQELQKHKYRQPELEIEEEL